MKIRLPSFSSMDTFSRCPRQYAEDVIKGRTPANKAMERGTHLHNSLEAAAKIYLDKGPDWEAAIDGIIAAPPEGILSQEEIESYMNRARLIVKDLVPTPGGVEAWFDDIGAAHGLPVLPIRGKIDMISSTALLTSEQARPYNVEEAGAVVDYKTISGEHRIKNSWEAKRSMQLKIYALATGINRAGFVYFPPKTAARAIFVKFTDEELRIAHVWLTGQLNAILACWSRFLGRTVTWLDEFEPIGDWAAWPLSHPDNMLCSKKWCGHWKTCIGAPAP